MRARMFKAQFAGLIKSGAKRQTIRPLPKRMPKPGERESWRMWTGKPYRSKQIELAQVVIRRVTKCEFERCEDEILVRYGSTCVPREFLDGFARADGFQNFKQMVKWFAEQHGIPFHGILIRAE